MEEASEYKKTSKYKKWSYKYRKKYYQDNKMKYAQRWKKYYEKNSEYLKEKAKNYAKANREHLRRKDAKRRKDPQFRICSNISRCIRQSLNLFKTKSGAHWEELVGYGRQDLIKHIEKQFKPGMSWDNYGEWHLDHIIPQSAFNFTDVNHIDFKRCWALKNLQPLWADENISKHNKLKKPFQPSLAI